MKDLYYYTAELNEVKDLINGYRNRGYGCNGKMYDYAERIQKYIDCKPTNFKALTVFKKFRSSLVNRLNKHGYRFESQSVNNTMTEIISRVIDKEVAVENGSAKIKLDNGVVMTVKAYEEMIARMDKLVAA